MDEKGKGRKGKGEGGSGREERVGKGERSSTWIFVQGPSSS